MSRLSTKETHGDLFDSSKVVVEFHGAGYGNSQGHKVETNIQTTVSYFVLDFLHTVLISLTKMSSSSNVIGVYRRMLRLSRTMTPEAKRIEAMTMIRKEFRTHKEENSEERISELLAKANSSLGYLKIVSPKTSDKSNKQSGQTRIVFGSGGEKGQKAVSNWTGSNQDPDQVKRHYNGLKRAGFTDNRSVVGGLF